MRAIELLLQAHQVGVLNHTAQAELVNWLQLEGRFGESIALLEPLVERYPDTLHDHIALMNAYFHTQRSEQLAESTLATERYFRAGGRWTLDNVSQFASGCVDCKQWERAVRYLDEAIALHQRRRAPVDRNSYELSKLYQQLAMANVALGNTREAIDAASAAIVCWSSRHEQRTQSLEELKQVLGDSQDLEAYVETLDRDAARTRLDSPILRKAIGEVYYDRNEFEKAIRQFELALELQPLDRGLHLLLVDCYDATNNSAAAIRQLLKLVNSTRQDPAVYLQLAERLPDDAAEAERAATSAVESSPNEAETHAALAEFREKQGRWTDAIQHWQRVAEIRRLEPTGLLRLTNAQLRVQQWVAASQSLERLDATEWPARFHDVKRQSSEMRERLRSQRTEDAD